LKKHAGTGLPRNLPLHLRCPSLFQWSTVIDQRSMRSRRSVPEHCLPFLRPLRPLRALRLIRRSQGLGMSLFEKAASFVLAPVNRRLGINCPPLQRGVKGVTNDLGALAPEKPAEAGHEFRGSRDPPAEAGATNGHFPKIAGSDQTGEFVACTIQTVFLPLLTRCLRPRLPRRRRPLFSRSGPFASVL
jgi:hypothetical protein